MEEKISKCLYAGLLPLPEDIEEFLSKNRIELVKKIAQSKFSSDELSFLIKDVDGVIAGGEHYTERVIESSTKLKIIARAGVGHDKVDIEAATKKGIYVTITPIPELSYAVAEQTFALILSFMKKVPEMNLELRSGVWNSAGWWGILGDMYHSTLGILGLGRIGREVAKRAVSFGMKVIYYDELRRRDLEQELGLQFSSLEELLRNSDVVSIHVPLDQKTKGMINESALRKMKRNAILVNTARGAIVDEPALSKALYGNWIGGAAIDVFSEEPPTPNHPFFKLGSSLPNLIVTEHSISIHTLKSMIRTAAQEVATVLSGHEPKYPVNKLSS